MVCVLPVVLITAIYNIQRACVLVTALSRPGEPDAELIRGAMKVKVVFSIA
jgi:homoserine kinase